MTARAHRFAPGAALRHGGLAAELAPELGAALLSFSVHGRELFRAGTAAAVAADPRNAACFPCAPWFGRLYGGLDFNDAHWDLAPGLPACDPVHPLHGEGWVRPWAVTAHTDQFLECVFTNDGVQEGRFPFPYEARQIAQIEDGALRLDLLLRNIGRETMPAGLAFHPYFPRSADTRLAFAAAGLWTPSTDGGGEAAGIPPGLNFADGAPLPDAPADHTYTEFSGAAEIAAGGSAIRLESDAPHLHLYAPAGGDYFCLEPVTHRPGAFGDDVLAPGGTMRLTMTVSAGPAGP